MSRTHSALVVVVVGGGGRGEEGGSVAHTQLNEQHQEQLNVRIRMSEVIFHICSLQCR